MLEMEDKTECSGRVGSGGHLLKPMLHGLFYFPQVPVSDGYDMGVDLEYDYDIHT